MKKLYFLMLSLFVAMAANAADLYLVGAFNGWGDAFSKPQYKMAENNNVYTITLGEKEELSGQFKIAGANWNPQYGTSTPMVIGTEYSVQSNFSGNCSLATANSAIANATVTLDLNTNKIKVEGAKAEVRSYYEIWGTIINGGGWTNLELVENGGVWSVTADFESGDFGIRLMNNTNQAAWYSANGDGSITIGTPKTLVQDGSTNLSLAAPGHYTFSFNPTNLQLTVTGESGDVKYPEQIYCIGELKDCGWNPTLGVPMPSTANGVYEATVEVTGSYFAFATTLSSSSTDWGGLGKRYGASTKDEEVVLDTDMTLAVTGDNYSFKTNAGEYKITVNLDAMTMYMTKVGEMQEPEITELYLIGSFDTDGEWNQATGISMTDEGGMFVTTATILENQGSGYGYFCFTTKPGDWDTDVNPNRYGPATSDEEVVLEQESPYVYLSSNAWKIEPGTYSFYFSTDDHNVVVEAAEEPVKPVEIVSFMPFSPSGNVATSEVDVKCSYVVENAADDATYTVYYGTDDNDLNQSVVGTATEATIHFTGLQPSKSYDYGVKLVVVSGTQTVESTIKSIMFNTTDFDSGIESITVEANGAVRYYNLQGVEVANPAAGLYIEVRNGNVSKVNVK